MNNEHRSYTVYCVLIHLLGLVKFFLSSVENKNINWLTVVCPLQYWIQPESEIFRFNKDNYNSCV